MSDFKQQVEELCLQYLTLCKCRDDYSPVMVEPELTDAILALIEQEILKLDNAYATMFQEQQDKEKAMRDALVTARGIAMEQEEDWIAVERTYLPERIIPFRDIQVVLDAVLGGSHE